ncbi:uncharacterized protein BT62DRAFT_1079379 [Guyanagaster necrorhizus]|uniref:Uncharacterized protein n=1 Tax=Guyanagaster necrorhizus TaxID=856835 RepID=A0A9P7VKI3_9AGAR|nr:uncharacterized protein BT62DRAFT_1079379 [Guyanagaster necrorhizus MCA 3950]KAG7442253.1 hypothetical protein BT62DRAFT_1079379 [Guyanagaster necrorhizus MCA 3950]
MSTSLNKNIDIYAYEFLPNRSFRKLPFRCGYHHTSYPYPRPECTRYQLTNLRALGKEYHVWYSDSQPGTFVVFKLGEMTYRDITEKDLTRIDALLDSRR